MTDIVNKPPHYTRGRIEVRDFISDQGLNFNRGSAVKYVSRAGHKDPAKEVEDLRKAIACLEHEIALLERGERIRAFIDADVTISPSPNADHSDPVLAGASTTYSPVRVNGDAGKLTERGRGNP